MKQYDFVKHKNKFFAVSLAIILLGIIFFLINGLNLDIQFSGGTRILIETNGEVDIQSADAIVEEVIGKSVMAQMQKTHSASDEEKMIYMLRLDIASNETLTDEEINLVVDTVTNNFDVKEPLNNEILSVTPSIGRETMMNGLKAALVASVLIILYVTWRFSAMHGLSAAVTALIAVFNDILVIFTLYIVFNLPMGESFIVAVLTIIGYSLNNTIVIYDRIRENSKLMKKNTLEENVNASINQTLTRTINTTVTTLLTVVTLYIFAAANNIGSLMEFSLPIIVGLMSGVYTSVCIAGPLWMMWRKSAMRKTLKSA
ncbi:MAG: protein translocase subunit SecF [Clostridiaceae bacterium]|nr:protein translocase subunit SecF [Clostridiaceae bacterium]